MAKYFSHWLPAEQRSSFSSAGYYAYMVKPNLTIISLNSNFCNNLNLWLLKSPRDPAAHLVWLVEELLKAEASGSKVHIISHIPPGTSDCLGAWSHQYSRIVERFSSIITGQFYGHSHWDEFSILYNNSEAISMAFVTPSLTPHGGLNPAYRVYYTDSSRPEATHLVMDMDTYSIDLPSANINTTHLNYKLEYKARKSLNISDLGPESWAGYVWTLVRDETVWQEFYNRYSREGPKTRNKCENECKQEILCRLVTFDREDTKACEKIKEEMKEQLKTNDDDYESWLDWE